MNKNEVDLIKNYGEQFTTLEEVLYQVEHYQDGTILGWSSDEIRRNKKAVSAVMGWKGDDFCYASLELRNDKKIALTAYQNAIFAHNVLDYIGSYLKNNSDFFSEIILGDYEESGGCCNVKVEHLGEDVKNDAEFFKKIINYTYRNDEECFVENGYFGDKLKNDKDFAKFVLSKYGHLIQCFGDEVKNDDKLKRIAIVNGGFDCGVAVNDVDDEKMAIAILSEVYNASTYSKCFGCLSERLKSDKKFIKKAVKNHPRIYHYLDSQFRYDIDIALTYILQHPADRKARAVEGLDNKLKENPDFVHKLALEDFEMLSYFPTMLRNKDFMLKLIKQQPKAIDYLNIFLRRDQEFMNEVIKINPEAEKLMFKGMKK